MATRTFSAYADPGHSWIKVPLKLIQRLAIHREITCYSYMRGEFIYLEEDQDASLLINALKANGITVTFKHFGSDKRSKIRNYQPYDVTKINWATCKAP
jgi:hypothetical protein